MERCQLKKASILLVTFKSVGTAQPGPQHGGDQTSMSLFLNVTIPFDEQYPPKKDTPFRPSQGAAII
jgi:hypothetical protein